MYSDDAHGTVLQSTRVIAPRTTSSLAVRWQRVVHIGTAHQRSLVADHARLQRATRARLFSLQLNSWSIIAAFDG
jgi:hypothetical protein